MINDQANWQLDVRASAPLNDPQFVEDGVVRELLKAKEHK
jgi:hypothetical protein